MQLISWNFLAVGSPSPIDIPTFERTKEPKTPQRKLAKQSCNLRLLSPFFLLFGPSFYRFKWNRQGLKVSKKMEFSFLSKNERNMRRIILRALRIVFFMSFFHSLEELRIPKVASEIYSIYSSFTDL